MQCLKAGFKPGGGSACGDKKRKWLSNEESEELRYLRGSKQWLKNGPDRAGLNPSTEAELERLSEEV